MRLVDVLAGAYPGQTLFVIGRGPSLASLTPAACAGGVVVAINQAIERVEELGIAAYSLQKDHLLTVPRSSTLIVHDPESYTADREQIRQYGRYLSFDNARDFANRLHAPSVEVCVDIAKLCGCAGVVYLACDAALNGNTGTYGLPATRPNDYRQHRRMVRSRAERLGVPVEWRAL
jgi:hypothetical protein